MLGGVQSSVFKMQVWRIAVLCALLFGVDALKISRINGPENALVGDTVTLSCEYDLEGGKLFSVKWFRNNVQFYWFRTADGSWAFPEKDMKIDLLTSNEKQVTLKNVSISQSGTYKCEVSLDAPLFTTETATHQLTVTKGSRIKNLVLMLPHDVRAGDQTAVLECTYELDGVHLDKVIWYKDLADFYTFQPGHPPIKETKPLPGIHVDVPASNGKQVVLHNINVDTGGNYRCQVVTDTRPPQSLSVDGKLIIVNPKVPDLEIPKVFLPGDVRVGEKSATLQCNYDLKGEKLYSLKWYKDNQEIYRFTPAESPQQQVFIQQGVNIDKSTSNDKQLTLTDITQDSAGLYHCQVDTEAPNFLNLQAKQVQLNVQEPESRTLRNPKIVLPENIRVGNKSITLKCDYELQGQTLYSVRWFKNNNEFYRFVPLSTPQKLALPLQGVNVNTEASDEKNLTLMDITKDTADLYRCEVSTDTPLFLRLEAQAQLNVLDAEPPKEQGGFFNRAYGWLRDRWNDIKPK